MTQLNDEERELLAKKGSSVVHCPESNLKLGSGICDIDLLFKVGVNVAIGFYLFFLFIFFIFFY